MEMFPSQGAKPPLDSPTTYDHRLWGRGFCAMERGWGKVVTTLYYLEYMCPGRYENICTWYQLCDLGDIT